MCLSLTPPNPMADSDSAYSAIKKDARILVVGAGRIGCEVLKTLVLSGCQDIYIIDKDFIEVDDLDGQFLFRPSHVGKTKAGVARRAVLNFRPDITINSCHGNVKDPEFDVNFFKQFNVVVNGVDNFDVWRHVNRLCLAADVPLIGSWTTGFLGQVTVHVKEVTECYECQPKPAFGIPLLSLFEAKYIVGNIIPNVATTIAIIAGLIVTETVKVLQNDKKNYRMTYCFENPKNKMLLVPVVPFKPSKSCYVCSEAPLSLEINTKCAKLRDIVEKVIKNKLGMNYPLILHGDGGCLYEDFKELDAAMVIKYEANLDKVLAEFSNPVTNGTMLEIEDFEQGVSCKMNIIHREAFDEEKEPDGMVLSGSTHATTVVKDTSELEADKNNEIETSPPRKKRKWAKVSGANPDDNSVAAAAPCSMSNKGACQICIKDLHHTVNCPWLKCDPPGSTVGPDYLVICRVCGFELHQPTMNWCFQCCEDEGGRVVEASTVDEYRRNPLKGYRVVGSKEEGDIRTELSYMRARLA